MQDVFFSASSIRLKSDGNGCVLHMQNMHFRRVAPEKDRKKPRDGHSHFGQPEKELVRVFDITQFDGLRELFLALHFWPQKNC